MGSAVCKETGSTHPEMSRQKSSLVQHKGFRNTVAKNSAKLANMVKIGPDVAIEEQNTVLIFIFGGPLSKKGKIVNELINTYNFKLIRLENIILKQLASSIPITNPDDVTSQITKYVMNHPEALGLTWALKHLKLEIVKDPNSKYLVELIPNLQCFLTTREFTKNPTVELESFENQFPISFAIDFSTKVKQVISDLTSAVDEIMEHAGAGNHPSKSDEADKSRTKNRTLLYARSVGPYISYFRKSGRLVSVDTSSFPLPLVWSRLCRIFDDFNIDCEDNDDIKVIFTFGKNKLTKKNITEYGLHEVLVSNQLIDLDDSPCNVLHEICKVINKCDSSTKNFYVNLEGTNVQKGAQIKPLKKTIVFFTVESSVPLSEIITPSLTNATAPMRVKMASTPENVNCVFPADTDTKLCKDITIFMSDCSKYS